MNQSAFQKICACSGAICIATFFIALLLAGFIPPLSASATVEEVVLHYQQHTTGIRAGMGFMLIGSAFYAMFTAVISGQMQRIRGVSPTVIYAQLAAGSFACLTFLMPAIFFIVASFRPERSAEITQTLNDLSWIMLVIPWMPFMAQNFSFAFAILSDRDSTPLFPRWLGYLNIWAPVSFIPGILLPFFKSGPFAWDGLLVFWIPGAIFVAWFFIVTRMLLKAIDRLDTSRQDPGSPMANRATR